MSDIDSWENVSCDPDAGRRCTKDCSSLAPYGNDDFSSDPLECWSIAVESCASAIRLTDCCRAISAKNNSAFTYASNSAFLKANVSVWKAAVEVSSNCTEVSIVGSARTKQSVLLAVRDSDSSAVSKI